MISMRRKVGGHTEPLGCNSVIVRMLSMEFEMLDADHWKTELSTGLGELMDQAVMAGARADQVFEAMEDELRAMREAWRQDPDPADYPGQQALGEPANDWPGAER